MLRKTADCQKIAILPNKLIVTKLIFILLSLGQIKEVLCAIYAWNFNQTLILQSLEFFKNAWESHDLCFLHTPYRLDEYELLNRTSSQIVREAAASGLTASKNLWKNAWVWDPFLLIRHALGITKMANWKYSMHVLARNFHFSNLCTENYPQIHQKLGKFPLKFSWYL